MSHKSTSKKFENLSWPEVQTIANKRGSTLVWPFGAIEQHGYHLPLSTDSLISEKILEEVISGFSEDLPILSLPPHKIGFSPEHLNFSGTLSMSSKLIVESIIEIGQQIHEMGFKRLILFNSHGGQIGLLQAAARELKIKTPKMAIFPCFIWSGVKGIEDLIPKDEYENGLHAALLETSLMMCLAPDLVDDSNLSYGNITNSLTSDIPSGWSFEGATPLAWMTNELTDSGVIGDPSRSNPLLGSKIKEKLVTHWINMFQSLLSSDWPMDIK
tara:strand:- start:5350 stop:6162 length:813 start_codon:yes stop_codon:yes gene_type:complete